jgi:O-antigen ligase
MTSQNNIHSFNGTGSSPANWKFEFKNFVSVAAIFWIMLWLSINTGPWVIREQPESMVEWLHWLRTLFPPLVLLFSGIIMTSRPVNVPLPGNVRLWLLYGLTGLLACLLSPAPLDATYWAVAYLSPIAATKFYLQGKNVLNEILHLNILNMIILTIFLLILIFFSFDALYVQMPSGIFGYGIESRMPMIAQMPMSRSSGMARFAAVPGVISFIFLWFGSTWKRFLWIIPLCFFGWIVYIMQSRGAVVGFGFVLAFEMLFLGGRKRIFAVILLLLFGLILMSDALPGQFFEQISDYMKRGQSNEDFQSMTGRTRAWGLGWSEILNAPVIGRGFQADRYLITEHIHNTYLYALLTSGFTGATAFVCGLLWSWILFLRAIRRISELDQKHKIFLIQAGGVLAFFTVRGVSEVSGAMFNVDFMIMLPIMTYLGILDREYGIIRKVILRW